MEIYSMKVSSYRLSSEKELEEQGILGTFNGEGILSCRPFDIEQHGNILHQWCNKPYSAKFWNMAGSYDQLKNYYQERAAIANVRHTMFFLKDKPLAFAETYPIIGSELEVHIKNCSELDYGIHFLMAPPRKIAEHFRDYKRSLSFFTLGQALRHLYATTEAERIYAEPDKENHKACYLAGFVGFKYLRDIQLSDKTAALFKLTKDKFRYKR